MSDRTLAPKILFIAYIALFIGAAIHPYDRRTWYAENIPIVLIVIALVVLYLRGVVFSSVAYLLMSILIFLHTIGGHYTFERVPFGFVTNLFGFHRNHFDRLAHFSVGFYAWPIAEALVNRKAVRSRVVLFLFPIFSIAFVAMAYELIEWSYASVEGGASGAAFLGSQGDIWDAQKDMLADTLGATLATTLFFLATSAGRKLSYSPRKRISSNGITGANPCVPGELKSKPGDG
jgi:putative membrane protein